MDGWMDGWMGGWVDGWMGGWMGDGWMEVKSILRIAYSNQKQLWFNSILLTSHIA
jgi:beta-glucanase (GH16 family)